MAWFKKKSDVLDLTDRYRKQQERLAAIKQESEASSTQESSPSLGGFGIFGMQSTTTTTTSSDSNSGAVDLGAGGSSHDEKRRRLAKRLMDMTDKIEDLSNQIYHLQQRLEVLEKKSGSIY